ncbi:DEAD/DEAH box helicase [Cellulomonas flavigena]|uniref:DEAD/DEAH box helicase n=1 Tax=Cellulomonas flavigena TaxID=1711 RepID=UPI000660D706|nr:DUF3516 domain-containing protein [Cellulomonas flavigena]
MSATLNEILDDLEDAGRLGDDDALYEAFMSWAASTGRRLYPHQEEALVEILAGNHVIAATPTGSGKSMIALAAHFTSMAHGGRSYYTAPLKALVSEKFFDLVSLFGADNVGMVTGDVSLNADAPIVCCTAEILANQSLREGPSLDADMVVMDEFHFYGDRQRGWAWQVPLLELTAPQVVAMSATLGDTSHFERSWKERTGRDVALVDDAERPVPLEFDYVVDRLPDTVERLLGEGRWPVYIVHFSQRDAVATAQSFDRSSLISADQKKEIAAQLAGVSFTKGFGQTLKSLLAQGIGVHHAGMLPRYRRLVERLTQAGLLPIVCGTDTLGVGINVPIRTVLMTSLVKYDGRRIRHVSAREFHQIAGRAGRAGFDTVGFVRVLAPEHEVESARERARLSAAQEAARDAREAKRARKKSAKKRKGPEAGEVSWTRSTFDRLVEAAPEKLTSRFEMTHAMVLNVLAGAPAAGRDPGEHLVWLARNNDDPVSDRNPHLRRLGEIYTSMKQAGVVEHVSSSRASASGEPRLRAATDLPDDFALNQPLSPFALAALELLDPGSPTFALDVVSVIESVLEDPRPLLFAQEKAARAEAVAAMKAEGLEYEERMAALEDVTWPRPLASLLGDAFAVYVRANPWIGDQEISPKSVVREMIENALTFTGIVGRYDVGRSEGIVLRYLTDAYRALRQIVPDELMTEELRAIISWLSALIRAVDSSLLDEWEAMSTGQALPASEGDGTQGTELAFGADEDGTVAFSANRHAFRTAIRRALFERVEAMSRDDVGALARLDEACRTPIASPWGEEEWDGVLERYWAEHEWIGIDQRARATSLCALNEAPTREDVLELAPAAAPSAAMRAQAARIEELSETVDDAPAGSLWLATQTLVDPEEDMDWRIVALVDVPASDEAGRVALATVTVAPR